MPRRDEGSGSGTISFEVVRSERHVTWPKLQQFVRTKCTECGVLYASTTLVCTTVFCTSTDTDGESGEASLQSVKHYLPRHGYELLLLLGALQWYYW